MRAWLPREHGLSSWVVLPLLAAVALQPACWPAVGAALAGFASFNAARRAAWPAVGLALAIALALGGLGLRASQAPALLLCTFAAAAAGAALALALFRQAMPRQSALEVGAIVGLCALGAALAVAFGSGLSRAAAVALTLASWQVFGLWWVRGQLAAVLPRRAPWRAGPLVGLALAALAFGAGWWGGLLAAPAALLLYPLRVLAHRPPGSPRDAKRVGFTELGWTAAALSLCLIAAC